MNGNPSFLWADLWNVLFTRNKIVSVLIFGEQEGKFYIAADMLVKFLLFFSKIFNSRI